MTMRAPSKHFAEPVTPPDGVFNEVANVFVAMRRTVSSFFELFALEVRRAGLTLVWMVAGGALAAMFIVSAWLGLMGALALWAVSLGASWLGVVIAVALGNLLAAATTLLVCIAMSRNLLFPATRGQFNVADAT